MGNLEEKKYSQQLFQRGSDFSDKYKLGDKWNSLEGKYKISENTAAATSTISSTIGSIGYALNSGMNSALDNRLAQRIYIKFVDWYQYISSIIQPSASVISREYNYIWEKSKEEIDAKKKEKGPAQHFDITKEELNDALAEDEETISENSKETKTIENDETTQTQGIEAN